MPTNVRALITEVAWQDRDDHVEVYEPEAYIVTQDPVLSQSKMNAPSQDGAYSGSAFAEESNIGHLVPFTTGAWDTNSASNYPTPEDLRIRIVNTGSLFDSGEYAYKRESDPSDQYIGMDDLRWLHKPQDPFGKGAAVHKQAISSVFSKVHHRYIVMHANGIQDLRLRYIAGSGGGWSSEIVVNTPRNRTVESNGTTAMVEMPDGSILMFYKTKPPDSVGNQYDIDMMLSSDGGETFSHVKQGIITDLYGQLEHVEHFVAASSGDWVRLDFWYVSTSATGVATCVSSDRGATWRLVNEPDGNDEFGSDSYQPRSLFDTCAGDDNGTFVRVRVVQTSGAPNRTLAYEIAVRDASWSEMSWSRGPTADKPGGTVTDTIEGVWLAGGSGRVFMMYMNERSTSAQMQWVGKSFIVSNARLTEGNRLSDGPRDGYSRWGVNDFLGWDDNIAWSPKLGQMTYTGDRLMFFTSMMDRHAGTGVLDLQGMCVMQWGGPSPRPMRLPINTHTSWRTYVVTRQWLSSLGPPAGTGASPNTAFLQSTSGTSTITPAIDGYKIQCVADVSTPGRVQNELRFSPTSPVANGIADHGAVLFSTKGVAGANVNDRPSMSSFDLSNPCWGVFVSSGSQHAGLTLQIAVHLFADESFVIYNVGTLDTVYTSSAGTLAGITNGEEYDFRIGFGDSATVGATIISPAKHFMNLHYGPSHRDGQWKSTGIIELSKSTSAITNEQLRFSARASTTVASDVSFTEFSINRQRTLSLLNQSNADEMRGFDCIPFDQLMVQNVMVRWGGAGGFTGDEFRVPMEYQFAASNITTPSPASVWRSTAASTQSFTFDAQAGSSIVRRMNHSAAGVFNTNSRYVIIDYSADSSISNKTRMVLDGLRAVVNVTNDSIVLGNEVQVEGDQASRWRDGEIAGWYANTGDGTSILKIKTNHSNSIMFANMTQALSSYGVSAGSTLYLWSTQIVKDYEDYPEGAKVIAGGVVDNDSPRYMRVTIPSSGVQGEPPEGYWFLGRLQAGMTLPITVPMDWATTDDEAGNVSIYTANSGVRRAYGAGDARRTISGTSIGDVDRWRQAFRSVVKNIVNYSQHPIIFCADSIDPNLHSMYCRLASSTELANVGWRYNSTHGRWEKIGDLKMTFEEEV